MQQYKNTIVCSLEQQSNLSHKKGGEAQTEVVVWCFLIIANAGQRETQSKERLISYIGCLEHLDLRPEKNPDPKTFLKLGELIEA